MMPNILLLSQDDFFADELKTQIELQDKNFSVARDISELPSVDIMLIDEDKKLLENINIQAPIFFMTSNEVKNLPNVMHIFHKPLRLNVFLNTLFSAINRFENSADGYLVFNGYELHPMAKEILNLRNNELIKLTEKEVDILKYLYKSGKNIVSKSELLQEVWGYSPDVSTHTIETHIYRLRQKVEHGDESAQLILTNEGGYLLKM